MKHKTIILAIMMLAAIKGESENLLKNPSFEEGAGAPESWVRYRLLPENAACNEEAAHTGKRGVSILEASDNMGAGWQYEKPIPVKSGEEYRLSGWIKSEAWGGNEIRIAWFEVKDRNLTWKSTASTKKVDGKCDWTYVESIVKVPENITFATIAAIRSWKAEGSTYFDDISLEKLSEPQSATHETPLPNLDWGKAIPCENISAKEFNSRQQLPVNQWQKMQQDAGELQQVNETLKIGNTCLDGVGWIGPLIKLYPERVYGFESEVKLEKAYNVTMGVAFFDIDGSLLELRIGNPICGTSGPRIEGLIFRTPPKTAAARFLLTQSRSSGGSSFAKFILLSQDK